MKQLTLALIGCGDRGSCYLKYLEYHPEQFRLVAIADPVEDKREFFRKKYNVPKENCFASWKELLSKPRLADIIMICTQDKMHYAPAMTAMQKGYDILLEKPISPYIDECLSLAKYAKENSRRVLVCHVLRYTPFYKVVKKFIDEGKLGRLMNINHTENVGNIHMSHSYVRGPWNKTSETESMLLAKCCHDTDLLRWFADCECQKVQSFGERSYFKEENAPEGSPLRCLDGCPHKDSCYYYAPKVYRLDTAEVQHFKAVVAGHFNPTPEAVDKALETSQYGRCVYYCDNDVVDHQVVNFEFENGLYATLTMSAFNKGGRTTVFMGTKGELRCDLERQTAEFYDFATMEKYDIFGNETDEDKDGHAGGDLGIMEDLYEYVAKDNPSNSVSDIDVMCVGYLMCYAAEEARKTNTVVDIAKYKEILEKDAGIK